MSDAEHPKHVKAFMQAVFAEDAAKTRTLLENHANLVEQINAPYFAFGAPALVKCRNNRAMVDVLLEFGADPNVRSDWDAGSFGVLDGIDPEMATYLIQRGATLDIHAAAALGMFDAVKDFLDGDPALIHARGGDGMLPLHFATSREIWDLLLERGADINARDIDHGSTAAQWAIDQPEKLRYLVERGAEVDIFMACRLGDIDLAKRILADDPNALDARIGEGQFDRKTGGADIYLYTLTYTTRPLHLAADHGHSDFLDALRPHISTKDQFLLACWQGDEGAARQFLADDADLVKNLPPQDQYLIADAAWEGNIAAVRAMLKLGFDVNCTTGAHESTPLDRAVIWGYDELAELLLKNGADVEMGSEFGTSLGTCVWGSVNFANADGDYPRCVDLLAAAGAEITDWMLENAKPDARAVLRRYQDAS